MDASYLLGVVIAAIALTIIAERRGVQAPLLLVVVGALVSFIPSLPRWELPPETILALVLPPLLYSAALEFSLFSFMKRIKSILNLGVGLVIASALVAQAVMVVLVPTVSLPVALMLGAAIAPPDAVSAVSIGRRLGLPSRLMTVLKGESLINDAAALTLFTAAAAAATGVRTFIDNGILYFLYTAFVGILVGLALGAIVHRIRMRLSNPTMITALAIVVPFAAYALAEEARASGVLAVVFAGFSLGHNATGLNFAGRLQEREVWRVADALLEAIVFAYMGLQFRFIFGDAIASGFTVPTLIMTAAAMLGAVIAVRIGWVFATAAFGRWRYRQALRRAQTAPDRRQRGGARAQRADGGRRGKLKRPERRRELPEPLSWRENAILSWTGMRGVVTLAAAAGVPLVTATGDMLPGREAVAPIALSVAIGTLLLQGLTLPWLIRRLAITNAEDRKFRQEQMVHAAAVADAAMTEALDKLRAENARDQDVQLAERLFQRVRPPLQPFGAHAGEAEPAGPDMHAITTEILSAQRRALIAERDAERLDDEVLREILEDIDLEQAVVASRNIDGTQALTRA